MRASKLNGVYVTKDLYQYVESIESDSWKEGLIGVQWSGHLYLSSEFNRVTYDSDDWNKIATQGVSQSIFYDFKGLVLGCNAIQEKPLHEIAILKRQHNQVPEEVVYNAPAGAQAAQAPAHAPAPAPAPAAAPAQAQAAAEEAAKEKAVAQAQAQAAEAEAEAQVQAAAAAADEAARVLMAQANLLSGRIDKLPTDSMTVLILKKEYVAIIAASMGFAEKALGCTLSSIRASIERLTIKVEEAEKAAAEEAEKAAAEKAAGAAAKEATSAQAQAAAAKKAEKQAANKAEGNARAQKVKVLRIPESSSCVSREAKPRSTHRASPPAVELKSSDFKFLSGLMTDDVDKGKAAGIDCVKQCVAIESICLELLGHEDIFSKANLEKDFQEVNQILKKVKSVSDAAEYIEKPKEASGIYLSKISLLVDRINEVLGQLKQKRAVIIAKEKVVENRVEQAEEKAAERRAASSEKAAARVRAKANKKEKNKLFKEKRAADQGFTARAKEEMGDNQPDILAAEKAFNDYTKEYKQDFFAKTSALSSKPEVTGGQSGEARDAKLFLLGFAEICLILLKEYTKVTYVKAEELVEFNKEFSIAIDGVGIVERNMKTFPLPDAGPDAKQLLEIHWDNVESLGYAAIFGKYGLLAQSADAACGSAASLFSVDSGGGTSSEDDSEFSLQAGDGSCFGNR